jgi:hypothetical protein
MPEQVTKIRLSSRLLREPQVFDDLGEMASGLARDLVLWAAWNNTEHIILHVPEFCKMFGYSRTHLFRPLQNQKYKDRLKQVVKKEEYVELFNNTLGWTLVCMLKVNLTFASKRPASITPEGELTPEENIWKGLQILTELSLTEEGFEKKKTGSVVRMTLNPKIIQSSRTKYQTLVLEDYLSLKTPGGHADDQARKMYLRCLWKRRYWDKATPRQGFYPSRDNYDDLLAIARINVNERTRDKQNALLLRKLLNRIGKLPSVDMTPRVTLDPKTGAYRVDWTRGNADVPKPPRKPKKQATVPAE